MISELKCFSVLSVIAFCSLNMYMNNSMDLNFHSSNGNSFFDLVQLQKLSNFLFSSEKCNLNPPHKHKN